MSKIDTYSNLKYGINGNVISIWDTIPSSQNKVQFTSNVRPSWESDTSFRNVTEARVSDTLAYIPEYMFYNCDKLTKITILGNVKIRKYAFSGTTNLSTIKIGDFPDNVLPYNRGTQTEGLFQLSGIKNLTIENGTSNTDHYIAMGSYAFDRCNNLEKITFPQTILNVYNSAFRHCISLKELDFSTPNGESVTFWSNSNGNGTTSLVSTLSATYNSPQALTGNVSITLPYDHIVDGTIEFFESNQTKINATNIQISGKNITATLPDGKSATSVKYKYLSINTNEINVNHKPIVASNVKVYDKTGVDITGTGWKISYDGVLVQGNYKNGKNIYDVQRVDYSYTYYDGEHAPLQDCINLSKLTLATTQNGGINLRVCELFGKKNWLTNEQLQSIYEVDGYKVPKSLKNVAIYYGAITKDAFKGCSYIEKVNISKGCNYINESAFEECTNLTHIDLSNITQIGERAFYHCKSLDSVRFKEGVIIKDRAFKWCASIKALNLTTQDNVISHHIDQSIYGGFISGTTKLNKMPIIQTLQFYDGETKVEGVSDISVDENYVLTATIPEGKSVNIIKYDYFSTTNPPTILYGQPFKGMLGLKSLKFDNLWVFPIEDGAPNNIRNYSNLELPITDLNLNYIFEGKLPDSLSNIIMCINYSWDMSALKIHQDFFQNNNVKNNPSKIKRIRIQIDTDKSTKEVDITKVFSNLNELKTLELIIRGYDVTSGTYEFDSTKKGKFIVKDENGVKNTSGELWKIFYYSRLWARYISYINMYDSQLTTIHNGVYNIKGTTLEYYPRGATNLYIADSCNDIDSGGISTGDESYDVSTGTGVRWSNYTYGPLQRCIFENVDIHNVKNVKNSLLMFKDCPNIKRMKINYQLLSGVKFYQLFNETETPNYDSIPSSVKIVIVTSNKNLTIREKLFEYATLDYLILPFDITTIEKDAFWRANIKTLCIPNKLNNLDENAFRNNIDTWGISNDNIFPLIYYYGTRYEFSNTYNTPKHIKLVCLEGIALEDDAYTININMNINNKVKSVSVNQDKLNLDNIDYYDYMDGVTR